MKDKDVKENNAKTANRLTFPQYFHSFDKVLSYRTFMNIPEMIQVWKVCRNADVPVFTYSDTSHCPQSKEDGLMCSRPSGK